MNIEYTKPSFAGVPMRKIIISLICCFLPALAFADTLTVRDNAPNRYAVVKGDTLWDISAKFFKDPWKWPSIWGLNKETIKDPHWIYPGDIVILDRSTNTLKVVSGQPASAVPATAEQAASGVPATAEAMPEQGNVEKLSPEAHIVPSEHDAIPTISLNDIGPFLTRPLVIDEDALEDGPVIISGLDGRELLSNNDIAYVKNLPRDKGLVWQVYRPGKELTEPSSSWFRRVNVLGHEANYLGDARVEKFGEISTLRIFNAKEEIYAGDYLVQAPSGFPDNFIPRPPDELITASVISIPSGVSMAGQHSVIVLNKGQKDGIQNGHVLALFRKGTVVKGKHFWSSDDKLPDERYGLVFVFRTFKNVSYALVMDAKLPVELADTARTP